MIHAKNLNYTSLVTTRSIITITCYLEINKKNLINAICSLHSIDEAIPVCLWVWQLLQENSAEVRPASAGTGRDTEHEFASVNEMTSTNVLQYSTTLTSN